METREKRPELADFANRAHSPDRRTSTPFGRLMLTAFLGYAFMYFVAFFQLNEKKIIEEGNTSPKNPLSVQNRL